MVAPADDERQAIPELERQVERASMFAQASFDRLVWRMQGTEAYVNDLVEVLRTRGVLQEEDLSDPVPEENAEPEITVTDATKVDITGWDDPDSPVGSLLAGQWPSIAYRLEGEELPSGPPVNCAERMHVCHAVCCKLQFALTLGEVDAGKVKWDLGYPYLLRHGTNGFCVHNDRETGGCSVYEDRPGVCSRYSCVNDRRIWKDFDNMVLNSEWLEANLAQTPRIKVRLDRPAEPAPGAADSAD
ncbi:MAG: hypothetical protein NVSMB32_02270 [Actinomycetota bacterium]